MFGLPILTFSTLGSTSAATSILGIPPILLLLGILFLAALGTASGIGMWIGHKWGWWVSSFYYVYGIFRNGAAIATVIAMSDALEGESRGLGFYLVKFGGRIVIHFLILLYLFSENVLGYFDLCDLDKWKAIGTLVAVCLGIVSVIHVFAGIE